MSFDKSTFNSIYDDILFNNNVETGTAKTADDLIRLGWLLGQSSIALNHSTETTCAIHEENLKNYEKFVFDKKPKPFFNIKGSSGDFNLNPEDFEKYLQLPCRGEYLNCDNEKISNADIEELLKTDTHATGPTNKRPCSDATSSNEYSAKKFIFRQSHDPYSMNSVPSTSISSSRTPTVLDRKQNNEGRFDFFNLNQNKRSVASRSEMENQIVGSDADQRNRRVNFQSPVLGQQKNEQNIPSSSNGNPFFAFDRTERTTKPNQPDAIPRNSFTTATEELHRQNLLKNGHNPNQQPFFAYGKSTKTLGTRRSVHSKFVPPIGPVSSSNNAQPIENSTNNDDSDIDPRLKNVEPKMIELIQNEIMHKSAAVDWDDIAGLEYAKRTIQEAVILPLLRPDIFTGLRGPPKGILLFGPPGTGKTLIGRCIASRSRSTFFSISASSLTSKWIGEGEKMVRALFAVASVNQPAVIFIDEIDSLLSQRSDNEHESSRRLKTEFLVQLDGARTTDDERILIVGATNRPQELDEAARRRLTKRLYIPLPELDARVQILTSLLKKERNQISESEINEIGRLTDGFSGADMKTLCHEALMGPIRSIRIEDMVSIAVTDVPQVNFVDFTNALKRVRASVSQDDLVQYEKWDTTYGLGAGK